MMHPLIKLREIKNATLPQYVLIVQTCNFLRLENAVIF